ncbi:MAG: ABC transporter permease [Actinomycetota bacterium]|nr:ABC transporter permease [Actinomycetota bacterium]
MPRYIIKRLIWAIPVFLGLTLIVFLIMFKLPGDPANLLIPKGATAESVEMIRAHYGLDKPWYIQYGKYLANLFQGDLGTSIRYKKPVLELISLYLPNSVTLAALAVILEMLIGIPLGIISALRPRSLLSGFISTFSLLTIALPSFWVAMILQITFGLKVKMLPISGIGDGSFKFYILPALTIGLTQIAYVQRITQFEMSVQMKELYIRAARAKGLSETSIRFHALRGASIPLTSLFGLNFGLFIGNAVLTETVFSWPGLGRLVHLAILQRDTPVVMGATLILVIIFLAINLITDIIHAYLDPTIKLGRDPVSAKRDDAR